MRCTCGEEGEKGSWVLEHQSLRCRVRPCSTWKRKQRASRADITTQQLLPVSVASQHKLNVKSEPNGQLTCASVSSHRWHVSQSQTIIEPFMSFPESGNLLTFGEADGGKLGLPDDVSDFSVPQRVTGIKGKVTWVSCGGSHTIAVTGASCVALNELAETSRK